MWVNFRYTKEKEDTENTSKVNRADIAKAKRQKTVPILYRKKER